jgi:5'-3' exoribonuclease 2
MVDPDSPILDFYPETFHIDMNGKKMTWQGVALLPFIDPDRLLAAMATRYPQLTDDERRRNHWGNNLMLLADGNGLYDLFCGLYTKKRNHTVSELSCAGLTSFPVLSSTIMSLST